MTVDGDVPRTIRLQTTVLEGHRFAHQPIAKGEFLLSWGLPFGMATKDIAPGQWLCNGSILQVLKLRHDVRWELPDESNFVDKSNTERYQIDDHWRPGRQVGRCTDLQTFWGYRRAGNRGVGTRNFVVVVGLTALTSSFAIALADRSQSIANEYSNVDGVTAVAHTEGETTHAYNLGLLRRTLRGFITHPNVGACLVVQTGLERHLNVEMLREDLEADGCALEELQYAFHTLSGNFEEDLRHCRGILEGWLPGVNAAHREELPAEHLSIALQCGGSDAFSGVSGNPLQGWVAREVVRHGGTANLAETPELVGAEAYIMKNVKDLDTAQTFVDTVERYKQFAARHGQNAEGNPSGGNFYRGLYNITLKSLGAAVKKPPDVCLDRVIEYGQRMHAPGYYFMDSPGNDLESVAGQVAAGCNVIFFTTGNGSITNFPFVPTVKIVTTTSRYELLRNDMDVNAGKFSDGASTLDDLGRETFDYLLTVASGDRTAGEKAGHSQVQIWRDWVVDEGQTLPPVPAITSSSAIPTKPYAAPWLQEMDWSLGDGPCTERVGLVLPTSMCASPIARLVVDDLNQKYASGENELGVVRFVTLPHTEGCAAVGPMDVYTRTLLGHLTHRKVSAAVLLEHGCEKTHNDFWRNELQQRGLSTDAFGWASVQADGGIDSSKAAVTSMLLDRLRECKAACPTPPADDKPLQSVSIAMHALGPVPPPVALALAHVARAFITKGASVVLPQGTSLLDTPAFLSELLLEEVPKGVLSSTLEYGMHPAHFGGLHLMQMYNPTPAEINSGLVAGGAMLQLVYCGDGKQTETSALVPMIQISAESVVCSAEAFDIVLGPATQTQWVPLILTFVANVFQGVRVPKTYTSTNVSFQIPRGLACSM